MIGSRIWFGAVAASLLVHCAVFVGWSFADGGARGAGEQGIEIGLGLLGDLGDSAADPPPAEPQEALPEPEREPPPEPEPPPPETPPTPIAEPEPLVEPVLAAAAQPVAQRERPIQPSGQVSAENIDRNAPAAVAPQQRRRSSGASTLPSAGGNPGIRRTYAALLAAHLNRYKRYPISARRRGREGTVTLRLVLDRTGRVTESRIDRPAQHAAFNEAALSMLQEAKPLPPFPDGMRDARIDVKLPVVFKLDRSR